MTANLSRNPMLEAAMQYAERGRLLLPCKPGGKLPLTPHGCKDATDAPEQITRWWKQYPNANIAFATGTPSGIWALDADGEEGLAALSELEEQHGSLPLTPCQITGGGGKQFFFALDGMTIGNRTRISGKSIDVRGEGGYCIVPPSVHPNGNQYEWVIEPGDAPFAPAPPWLLDFVTSRKKPASQGAKRGGATTAPTGLDAMARSMAYIAKISAVSEGERNDTAFRVACVLVRDFALSDEDAWLCLIRWNAACSPPLEEPELRTILRSARENGSHPVGGKLPERPSTRSEEHPDDDLPLTELGNAQRLIREHGDKLRFDVERGLWLAWDNRRFAPDLTGASDRLAKGIARSFLLQAASCADETRRKALIQHGHRSEKAGAVHAALRLAATEPGVGVTSDELDVDPFALNCLNGTIDLRTGELRPHRQADLIRKLAPVEYHPDAPAPLWDSFLARIMDGNSEMISYLSRIAGLCLTADISVQELFIFWGSGANGKSVFLDTSLGLLGEYAGLAPDSLLTARSYGEHPTEIADLRGRRLVVASETEESARLRLSMIKRMTGDRTLKGRFMRQDFFEFPRTHKTILVTNNRPVVSEQTQAVWRRIRLVPFTVTIPESERDPALLDKLRAEWPGILAWAVRGCLDWQRSGMQPPHDVLAATEAFRGEQDLFGDFIAECLIRGAGWRISRHLVYHTYSTWAERTGEKPITRVALFERLRGLAGVSEHVWREPQSSTVVRGFTGIGRVADCETAASEAFSGVSAG